MRRRIGVVFQSPSLDRKLTVADNMLHHGHLYGLRGQTLRAGQDEMLTLFGLADRASDYVDRAGHRGLTPGTRWNERWWPIRTPSRIA